jgi:hypothetical protein
MSWRPWRLFLFFSAIFLFQIRRQFRSHIISDFIDQFLAVPRLIVEKLLTDRHFVEAIFGRCNVWSTQCLVDAMFGRRNVWSTQCLVDATDDPVIWSANIWLTQYLVDSVFGRLSIWPTQCLADSVLGRLSIWPAQYLADSVFGRLSNRPTVVNMTVDKSIKYLSAKCFTI